MDERMDSLDEIRRMAPDVVNKMGEMLGSPKVPAAVKIKGMGSLFCLRNTDQPKTADPAKGNLTEFQILWGDNWIE